MSTATRRPRLLCVQATNPANRAAPRLIATARLAAQVAAVLLLTVAIIALITHLALATQARHLLAFSFTGIPARPAETARIFLHNLWALGVIAGLLLVAQAPCWVAKTAPGTIQRVIRHAGEALLAAAVSANVLVVGAALGAYGTRMISASLPHGPVELAAYALALALYLEGRRRPLPLAHVASTFALAVALLALAAALETFVNV